jgi:dihydroorotase
MAELVRKMSLNPAKALKLQKGTLSVGSDADITIIDPAVEWTVDTSQFRSKSRNTPFNGWKLIGRAVQTIVGGK